jgi:hypothetical protein
MQPAKLTTLAGKLIGITLGCFAGEELWQIGCGFFGNWRRKETDSF